MADAAKVRAAPGRAGSSGAAADAVLPSHFAGLTRLRVACAALPAAGRRG
jgi:hypothetical protein